MNTFPRLLRRTHVAGAIAAVAIAVPLAAVHVAAQNSTDRWVGTWATATVGRPQTAPQPGGAGGRGRGGPAPFMQNQCPPNPAPAAPGFLHFSNQTLRQVVRTSIGGSRLRVVLSNSYGTQPLTIGAAHVALRDRDAAIRTDTGRKLTFSGGASFTIPAGAVAFSDPVDLTLPPTADLAIDLFLPGDTNTPSPLTMHSTAVQTNYVSEPGNHAGAAKLPTQTTTPNWFVVHRVDVLAPASVGGIVAYGDSITDGTRSTADTNNRWPDHLTRRLLGQTPPLRMGVMNAGIAGNRVLSDANFQAGVNAQARFDQHVAAMPGATHVVFMEGINDIGQARENPTPSADDVIAGHKQIIERARARGLKIYGATLTPFYGAAYYTEVGEAKRQAVNTWIRSSNAYDAVIDFDRVTRDPSDPKKFLAAYDSCDHLHPSDAGYKAMADAIDLALFRTSATSSQSGVGRPF
jgi:lysophospholipase L1-like esterase